MFIPLGVLCRPVQTVVFDFVDNWSVSGQMGIRSIEFKKNGVLLPLTRRDFTYIQSSAYYAGGSDLYYAHKAFDTTYSKIGDQNNGWIAGAGGYINQRIGIIFNVAQDFDEIVVNNYHHNGTVTYAGVKTAIVTLTPEYYIDNTYGAAVPNGIVLPTEEVEEHPVANAAYDQTIWPMTAAGSVTAKSVVFDFTTNYGDVSYSALRALEFLSEGVVIPLISGVDFTASATTFHNAAHAPDNAFDTTLDLTGSAYDDAWSALENNTSNQRLIVVFTSPQTFNQIDFHAYSDTGASLTRGWKDVLPVTISDDAIVDTTYNAAVPNSTVLDSLELLDIHAGGDVDLVQTVWPKPPSGLTAKSVIFDVADNYGNASIAIRSIEFKYAGVTIPMERAGWFLAYSTTDAGAGHIADFAFDTRLSKIGQGQPSVSWISNAIATNQRLIIVFDDVQRFDEIVINNYSSLGSDTEAGAKNVSVTISDDAIVDTTYGAAISNSTLLSSKSPWPEHVALDQADDQTIWPMSSSAEFFDAFGDVEGTLIASHTPDTPIGLNVWDSVAGVASVQSNRLQFADANSSGSGHVALYDTGMSDGTIKAKLNSYYTGAANRSEGGIVFRAVDENNFWLLQIATGGGFLNLYTASGGGFTPLAAFGMVLDEGTDYTIYIKLDGSNITINEENSSSFTYSSATYASATKHGFRVVQAGNPNGLSSMDTIEVFSPPEVLIPDDGTTLWTNVTAGTNTALGSINKVSGGTWTEGASFGSIPANSDGALFWKSGGTVSGTFAALGTTVTSDPWSNTTQYTFGIFVGDSAQTSCYHNSVSVLGLAPSIATTEFGLRRVGTSMEYLRDGVVVHTIAGVTQDELFMTGRFYNYTTSTIEDCRIEVYNV